MATYNHDLRRLKRAFADFFENLPFYGLAVMCCEDPNLRDVAAMISKRVVCYGLNPATCDFAASEIEIEQSRTSYLLHTPEGSQTVILNSIGIHNVLNSLAAYAVAYEINIPIATAATALAEFGGVGRRLERLGKVKFAKGTAELVDDYGHHPTEIKATVEALRQAYPQKRIVLAFQPHRYSRTRDTFDALADVLATVDALVLTEIYTAGEEPIPTISGEELAHAVRLRGENEVVFVADLADIPKRLAKIVQDDDLVLTMGAGSITKLARQLIA